MKQINRLVILIVAIMFVFPIFAFCETEGEENIPDWAKRINFGIDVGTNQKPYAYFETIQPLYQDFNKIHTVFIQPRFSYEADAKAGNLGFGYRRLLSDSSILLGANTFFDYEFEHDHYRAGLGFEAFIKLIECRSNIYIGLSPRRIVKTSGTMREYEKAVDGIDWEFGLPVPFMNWIKFYGGGYWYNYEKSKNKEGWRIRTEIKPFKFTTINFITYDDNKGSAEYEVDARVSLPFGLGGENDEKICNIGLSETAYPEEIDHSDKVLDRVERQYKIEVERYVETASGTIEIRRGDS